mmetsp:Transcript_110987/g.277857  ORF Transcript_110987/g.277857 Transcript_110987/m.277857 type:complete len:266 (+) Transcript_110987:1058-1855(+)
MGDGGRQARACVVGAVGVTDFTSLVRAAMSHVRAVEAVVLLGVVPGRRTTELKGGAVARHEGGGAHGPRRKGARGGSRGCRIDGAGRRRPRREVGLDQRRVLLELQLRQVQGPRKLALRDFELALVSHHGEGPGPAHLVQRLVKHPEFTLALEFVPLPLAIVSTLRALLSEEIRALPVLRPPSPLTFVDQAAMGVNELALPVVDVGLPGAHVAGAVVPELLALGALAAGDAGQPGVLSDLAHVVHDVLGPTGHPVRLGHMVPDAR